MSPEHNWYVFDPFDSGTGSNKIDGTEIEISIHFM